MEARVSPGALPTDRVGQGDRNLLLTGGGGQVVLILPVGEVAEFDEDGRHTGADQDVEVCLMNPAIA